MTFEDEEQQKQFEEDLKMAQQLQQEEDEQEEKKYGKSSVSNNSKVKDHKEVAMEIEQPKEEQVLKENEWKCKDCTLVNTLPKYRCDACNEMNSEALSKYCAENESKKSRFSSGSYNATGIQTRSSTKKQDIEKSSASVTPEEILYPNKSPKPKISPLRSKIVFH